MGQLNSNLGLFAVVVGSDNFTDSYQIRSVIRANSSNLMTVAAFLQLRGGRSTTLIEPVREPARPNPPMP